MRRIRQSFLWCLDLTSRLWSCKGTAILRWRIDCVEGTLFQWYVVILIEMCDDFSEMKLLRSFAAEKFLGFPSKTIAYGTTHSNWPSSEEGENEHMITLCSSTSDLHKFWMFLKWHLEIFLIFTRSSSALTLFEAMTPENTAAIPLPPQPTAGDSCSSRSNPSGTVSGGSDAEFDKLFGELRESLGDVTWMWSNWVPFTWKNHSKNHWVAIFGDEEAILRRVVLVKARMTFCHMIHVMGQDWTDEFGFSHFKCLACKYKTLADPSFSELSNGLWGWVIRFVSHAQWELGWQERSAPEKFLQTKSSESDLSLVSGWVLIHSPRKMSNSLFYWLFYEASFYLVCSTVSSTASTPSLSNECQAEENFRNFLFVLSGRKPKEVKYHPVPGPWVSWGVSQEWPGG